MPETERPKTLTEALVILQASLPRIIKDTPGQVGTREYRYANLSAITDAMLPFLASLGLAWTCCPSLNPDGNFVLAYALHHVSGDHITGEYPLPSSGTPQQIGSAITYARRYALTAVTGIAPAEDDDDAAAAEKAAQADAERDQAGRMTQAQKAAHDDLRRLEHPRKADRGPVGADQWQDKPAGDWQDVTPENKPGTSNQRQHTTLYSLYTKNGLKDKEAIYADLTDRTGRVITSAKDLSYVEAAQAITVLADLAEGHS